MLGGLTDRGEGATAGYAHPEYARALAEYGTPRELPRCGGWILERPIPGVPFKDAMACYPLFACRDWSGLQADLDDIGRDLVSIALVTDPFGDYDENRLHEWFPDRVLRFKEHYALDLHGPIEATTRKRARTYAHAALRELRVEVCPHPIDVLDEWTQLYGCLADRHHLEGIHTFSRGSFAAQMNVPGFVMFRARYRGDTVGMQSWYVQGQTAYLHLVGMSPVGYKLRASYAMCWSSIQHFRDRLHWLDFGGAPGIEGNGDTGLARFKRGWSSGTRPAYFCGRILNHEAYAAITRLKNISDISYFPVYRAGEFK